MIDTIVLILSNSQFKIVDHDRFEPSTKGLYDDTYGLGSRSYLTCKQNPTKTELKNGIYKPRLTVTKRFYNRAFRIMMKLEFSAPKLLFGNNFEEVQEDDYFKLVYALREKLRDMGVEVSEYLLFDAPVSTIHYSKNVKLTNGLTPFTILKEIQTANISRRLDFNQTDFRNEGHSFKFRTNSYEISFYDKMRDIQQAKISEKRAIEKDNAIQIGLFEELRELQRDRPLEIVRMEIRLNQRQKIEQVLRSLEINAKPTLRDLFKKDIAQKVLLYYLDLIEENIPKSYYNSKSSKDFLAQFIIDNPSSKIKDAILSYGFHSLLHELSVREIRSMFQRTPVRSWYRFIKQINGYNYERDRNSNLKPVRESVIQFVPLRAVDFNHKMLNNDKYQTYA